MKWNPRLPKRLLTVLAVASAPMAIAQAPAGLYTAAQAAAGQAVYGAQCASCHGASLEGTAGPPLKGDMFQQLANAQKLTPASLYKVTAETMPKGMASLTPADYAAVTAYMLQQNGYAAGQVAFAADCAQCAQPLRTGPVQLAQAPAAPPNQGDHGVPQAPPPATPVGNQAPDIILSKAITANVDVTDAQMLAANANENDWLLYGRTYDNMRYSPLTQITTDNVAKLRPNALIQTGIAAAFETSPIVVDGTMYFSTPGSGVQAYDAVTGAPKWRYMPKLLYTNLCCGPQSRGVGIGYGKVFVAQLDARVVALDARTGKVVWATDPKETMPPPDPAFYSFTLAPQIYNGMVIVGSAGAEYPTRGFVQAYDQATGKLLWRFHTTAGPGEPGAKTWDGDDYKYGGGSVWSTPAIDVERGLVIFATGNPNADYHPSERPGDNLYTVSIVAISAKTGKIAWWYQMVPHDEWDYDAAAPVLLFDVDDGKGGKIPVAGEASKEGHLFMVDRRNGKLVRKSDAFVLESPNKWTKLSTKGVTIYPGVNGGNTWSPPAFSPRTKYFYVPATNQAWTYTTVPIPPYKPGDAVVGQRLGGTAVSETDTSKPGVIPVTGSLSAIDVNTGKIAWQYKSELPMGGGGVVTASDVLFHPESTGDILAFDARDGRKLWTFHLGAGITAPPITYRVNGKQYVAIAAGGLAAGGFGRNAINKGYQPLGDVVAIFSLPD